MNIETFGTSRYIIDIELGERVGRIVLTDTYSGVAFADSDYRYSAFVEHDGRITHLDGLHDPVLDIQLPDCGGKIVSIAGRLGGPDAAPAVRLRHRIYMPEDGEFLEDQIEIESLENSPLTLRGYRFAFRKRLERPKAYGGPGIDIENHRLIALPFRVQPDGKKHDYPLNDIYNAQYLCSEFTNPQPTKPRDDIVDRDRGRSEGWAWSDGETGLLIIKYNPRMVEFSMLETERTEAGVYLDFGGAAPSLYDEPVEMKHLGPRARAAFGLTRYHFYEGLWRTGSYMFRDYISGLGHGLPDNYDPPIHWNELYDVGRHHSNRDQLSKHYTFETMKAEAAKARDIGCEALYLDPGWEVCEGGTIWDEERLGSAAEFVREMSEDYGLKVGLRTVGRSYCDAYPGMYRRMHDGAIGFHAPHNSKPFYEPCICSDDYREEKLKRILKVVDAGMSFVMFDEFDWRGPCFAPNHGHPVPTTPSMHAKSVCELITEVHRKHPDVLIEAHDTVWPWSVRYLPIYYLHDPGSFDEGWAFEFMWNPLEDLLSGRALSLFYYMLAYDLPLYLHINMGNDNENCLAFWWYASTVRHLGIGGKGTDETRYQAYKRAMAEYKSLKSLYTCGEFSGQDELTHIHVLPDEGRAVINAFNLTDAPVSRQVEVRLNDLGLMEDVTVYGAPHEIIRGKLVLTLEIPPFSPAIVKLMPH